MHGVFVAAVAGGPVGNFFAGTGIAYLEHNCHFKNPVRPGDTITITWTISEKTDKPNHSGGLVSLTGVCRNQRDEVVVEADAKLLVRNAGITK